MNITIEQKSRYNATARKKYKKMTKLASLGDANAKAWLNKRLGSRRSTPEQIARKNARTSEYHKEMLKLADAGDTVGLAYIEKNRKNVIRYRKKHPDRIKKSVAKHHAKMLKLNPNYDKDRGKKYYWANKAACIQRGRKYKLARRKRDPKFRLACNLRHATNLMCKELGMEKHPATTWLLGISQKAFAKYLEKQFKKGMSWDNYGTIWNVDHRMPISSFDLNNPKQLIQCQHYSNLQPMYGWENQWVKRDRILPKELARFNRIWACNKVYLAKKIRAFKKVVQERTFRMFLRFGKIDPKAA